MDEKTWQGNYVTVSSAVTLNLPAWINCRLNLGALSPLRGGARRLAAITAGPKFPEILASSGRVPGRLG